ncbi:hypothetical protein CEUSTIGMA_g13426.t1 [Chlamydomonas eustigma]|uniref:Phytanoyl-CoA dioxygenase n=1 Tax=Chlamydomonas eustigma TaxID=1157962 RepID=A0A250XT85_9CHLO|nr:hypothetical protein CEUSTIGMA_g13426.t1 [Chlamydomonas eustigma]|eukprot:GAX86010.1 hypothetical protein CEUSTIGMA_g13426.t1 [Chlamydomonas eustigma]
MLRRRLIAEHRLLPTHAYKNMSSAHYPTVRSADVITMTSEDLYSNRLNVGRSENDEMRECYEIYGYCIQRPDEDGIILKRDTMRRLHNLGWPLKSMRRGGSSGMSDHDSLIVDVVQDESHRRPQPPHIDYPLSSKRELLNVAILAVTEFSLYVYPRSHTLVREAIRFLGDESNFHHSSNSSSDSIFSRHLGLQVPIKVCLKAGELLIFDGYLVHAGTEGEVGVVRPRLHLYLQECHPNVVASDAHGHTSTYPLNLLHPNVESSMFASKFARIVMT